MKRQLTVTIEYDESDRSIVSSISLPQVMGFASDMFARGDESFSNTLDNRIGVEIRDVEIPHAS